MRYWLVMPAAGAGRRFGSELPKQYSPLAGRSVIDCSLAPFLSDPRCRGIVVVVAGEDTVWPAIRQRCAGSVPLHDAPGGAERADSVLSGLQQLSALGAADDDLVLVHDAARPCLPRGDLDSLLRALAEGASAALLATPLADTLKREAESGHAGGTFVAQTLPRRGLWRALTPQAAPLGRLRAALQAARARGEQPTDESQALEAAGVAVRLVAGSAANLKITTPADLRLAQALLAQGELP
ncbi:MAG: 4-diphosphocytidyl-2C-methyl-D-erythritol synthase [Pseudomonadota bacterium]|jgi:2-C-methyl-D-erythritol 4-phosphate cytidylyltransferase